MNPKLSTLTDCQIEALLAEKVMGWTLEQKNGWSSWWEYHDMGKTKKYAGHAWHPLTDLNNAFKVWNKLKHRKPALFAGEHLTACAMLASDDEEDNEYAFEEDGTQIIARRHVKAIRETPARAICVAALLAVDAVEDDTQGGGA